MSFSFHPEAEEEFNKAIDYYEEIEPGYDFALEVYSTIRRSVDFPKAWAILGGEVRRSLVRAVSILSDYWDMTEMKNKSHIALLDKFQLALWFCGAELFETDRSPY